MYIISHKKKNNFKSINLPGDPGVELVLVVLAVVPVVVVSVAVEGVASGGGERAGVAWGGSRGKQEHTLFNDLRRKLAKRSKELVNLNIFFSLPSKKKYKI